MHFISGNSRGIHPVTGCKGRRQARCSDGSCFTESIGHGFEAVSPHLREKDIALVYSFLRPLICLWHWFWPPNSSHLINTTDLAFHISSVLSNKLSDPFLMCVYVYVYVSITFSIFLTSLWLIFCAEFCSSHTMNSLTGI